MSSKAITSKNAFKIRICTLVAGQPKRTNVEHNCFAFVLFLVERFGLTIEMRPHHVDKEAGGTAQIYLYAC